MIKIEMYPNWNEMELGIVTQHSFMLWYNTSSNTPILNQISNIKTLADTNKFLIYYFILFYSR